MKDLSAFLTEDPDFIYKLLANAREELKILLPFGAANLESFDQIYYSIPSKDIEKLNFPSSLNLFERAKAIARQELTFQSKPPYVDVFIKGIGVCDHLNFFALMVLAKEYDFTARLENIHSDETHTYVVLNDNNNREYILDLWSDSALKYDNSLEWNEIVPRKYVRRAGASFSVNSFWTSQHLRSLWPQLEEPEVLEAKKNYNHSVMARALKSKGPQFFPPVVKMPDENVANGAFVTPAV